MLLSGFLRSWQSVAFILVLLLSSLISVDAYFIVNQPGSSTSWKNGSPYPVSWTLGLQDGFDTFDIEITRLSRGGIYFVAKELPVTMSSLNVVLQDVPAGDDYFLICINSTAGVTYSVSSRFSVVDANATGSNPSPASAPTVTVSGVPNPLSHFAQTFGPSTNGVPHPGWSGIRNQITAISVAVGAALIGGVMILY
ncbi:uncharacterized protein F5891DRAFT_1076695 [Suillus fuscotomentosus]|uniref:Uncharacterized protein n=1 Tax=Suillus fuscotomentosus TaxID=1912939 RepID=A0AAD4DPB3_9AGAM|nr:uncharacterized protein F5891DRAFT_1076695 [Suillus fuscotomentosus]KAG1887930.1 hypothetical protein F5891DRAFT_1076695 [Suillus fuscotomentosus]